MTKLDIIHEIHKESDARKRPALDVCLDHLLALKQIVAAGRPAGEYANPDKALVNSKMGIVVDSTSYDEDRRYR